MDSKKQNGQRFKNNRDIYARTRVQVRETNGDADAKVTLIVDLPGLEGKSLLLSLLSSTSLDHLLRSYLLHHRSEVFLFFSLGAFFWLTMTLFPLL